jgi:hypothetical protein
MLYKLVQKSNGLRAIIAVPIQAQALPIGPVPT